MAIRLPCVCNHVQHSNYGCNSPSQLTGMASGYSAQIGVRWALAAMSDHSILKVAVIVMDNKAIQCTIRKLYRTRATLEVPSTLGIPEKFSLVIDGIQQPMPRGSEV